MNHQAPIFLREQDRQSISALIEHWIPDAKAWAYGSRVKGTAHEASDLDVVLKRSDGQAVQAAPLFALRQALSESNIPILVDLRDWAQLPESFQAEIDRHSVLLSAS